MHEHAQFGVAAHWQYKESSPNAKADNTLREKVAWLRQVLHWKEGSDGPGGFLERFQSRSGARSGLRVHAWWRCHRPAYRCHTNRFCRPHTYRVWHRCGGAKVDGVIVPLSYTLRTGEKVEVLKAHTAGPSRDWLNQNLAYLKAIRARYRVRHWFRQLDYGKNLSAGKELFERDMKRLGLDNTNTGVLLERFKYETLDDLLAPVGHGSSGQDH
jgi:GTP pyrophosphokinase